MTNWTQKYGLLPGELGSYRRPVHGFLWGISEFTHHWRRAVGLEGLQPRLFFFLGRLLFFVWIVSIINPGVDGLTRGGGTMIEAAIKVTIEMLEMVFTVCVHIVFCD
jgi:hypothetical protein